MTQREQDIFNLIAQQPMISQAEIADRLMIARSSVAVYIASMIKQGIIQGRGYILKPDEKQASNITIIGTIAVDFFGVIDEMPNLDIVNLYENPSLSHYYGGTAKNTAEVLTSLGKKVQVIAATGSDIWGQASLQECIQHDIGVDGCITVDGSSTDMYWEIRCKNPEKIIFRLASCKLNRYITPEVLISRRHLLTQSSAVVVEDGVSTQAIQYLVDSVDRKKLFLETTDPAVRGVRIRDFLPAFGGIITSSEYLCRTFENLDDPVEHSIDEAATIARFLKQQQICECLFTFGPKRLCYLHNDRLYISDARFLDGAEERSIYQRFQLSRSCIVGTFVHCKANGDSPESVLRKVAIARHHAILSGKIVPYDFSVSTISKYYSQMEDHLQIISLM